MDALPSFLCAISQTDYPPPTESNHYEFVYSITAVGIKSVKLVTRYGIDGRLHVGISQQILQITQGIRATVMTHESNPTTNSKKFSPDKSIQAEADLFNAIIDGEGVRCELKQPIDASAIHVSEQSSSKIRYPWNPGQPESGDFFNYPLDDSPLHAFDASEVNQQAEHLFSQLDQLWDTSLQSVLKRKFNTVPQTVLATIAAQAETLFQTGDNLIDQLATCVQAAIPQWGVEDLQVLARPVAYAMRGETQESDLFKRNWQTLSATEQAKLSLMIANYAIQELSRSPQS